MFGGTNLNIPLIELPVLLEPLNNHSRLTSLTERESGARKIFYTHYKDWEDSMFPNGEKYGFDIKESE